MAGFNPIILSVDDQAQTLVSFGGSLAAWPNLFQGDTRDIQIQILQPTGNPVSPYSIPNLAGYVLYVTMGATPNGGGTQTIYVGPIALTWNAALIAFTGMLNLTGSNLATAIGANASVAATAELNLSNAGIPQGIYQNTMVILAPENPGGVVVPQPAASYSTTQQIAAAFVPQNGGNPGQGRIEISPNGNKFFIFRNNDGTENIQRIN